MKGERPNSLALALKGFLSDYLPRVRGTSPHTILSYRDAIKLLLVHLSRKKGIPVANLTIEEIGVTEIVAFLDYLERDRNNGVGTKPGASQLSTPSFATWPKRVRNALNNASASSTSPSSAPPFVRWSIWSLRKSRKFSPRSIARRALGDGITSS